MRGVGSFTLGDHVNTKSIYEYGSRVGFWRLCVHRAHHGIAMPDAVLAAFFLIDDELHRDACLARPDLQRPAAAIADQIARNVKQAALLPGLPND